MNKQVFTSIEEHRLQCKVTRNYCEKTSSKQ